MPRAPARLAVAAARARDRTVGAPSGQEAVAFMSGSTFLFRRSLFVPSPRSCRSKGVRMNRRTDFLIRLGRTDFLIRPGPEGRIRKSVLRKEVPGSRTRE